MTAADRDTLAALIGELRQYADDSDDARYGTLSTLLVRQYLDKIETEVAARDRRVAAQTEDTIFDEFPDNLTIAELRHAILLGRRLDTTEGTHHD